MAGVEALAGKDKAAIAQDYLVFDAALDQLSRDPLATFQCKSEAQRQLLKWCGDAEVYMRSGNSSGKTFGGAALGVALARGLTSLGGMTLPYLGTPNVGWVLTQTYKQQAESSQKAYLKWLGKWPHHIAYVVGKGKGYVEIIYVKTDKCAHGHGEQCQTCSKIVFHCEESKSNIGGRIDWAHADEPPLEQTWREIRMRRQAGKKFIRFITATPLERERWYWLRDEFSGCTVYESPYVTGKEAFFGEAKDRRAEIRSTLYDNAALSDDDIDAFESDLRTDPFADARRRGDYVDLAGRCPFDVELLQKLWLPRTKPPKERLTVTVQEEVDTEEGRIVQPVRVELEAWERPKEGEKYFIIADPSAGIADKKHDPAGVAVFARSKPRLVARYNGYLKPYGVGSLCAMLGKTYNRGIVDVDMTGGYGGPTLTAMAAARYGNIFRDIDPDKPGQATARLGFRISASNRGEIVGSIQQALLEDSCYVPSREMVECLLGVTIDETGRPQSSRAKKGRFDEDMILLGRALYLMSIMPKHTIREVAKDPIDELFANSRKRRPDVIRERW